MGVTMFWQQRMMPSTADPTQQKIFMLMPVIFTFMFLTVPSGLVIYWLDEQPADDRPAVPYEPASPAARPFRKRRARTRKG